MEAAFVEPGGGERFLRGIGWASGLSNNFPSALAQMMDLCKGEVVEWVLTPDGDLLLRRGEKDEGEGNESAEKNNARDGAGRL